MKISKQKIRLIILVTVLLLQTVDSSLFAQLELPGEADVDDVPEAPITDYIMLLGVLGIILGYWFTRKRA